MADPSDEVCTSPVFGRPSNNVSRIDISQGLDWGLPLCPLLVSCMNLLHVSGLGREGAGLRGLSISLRQVGGRAVKSYL